MQRPWNVAAQAGFQLPIGGGGGGDPGFAALGVAVERRRTAGMGIAASFCRALPGSRQIMASASGGDVQHETTVGNIVAVQARPRWGRQGISFVAGMGPALAFGGDFGTVPLLQAEAGIELRSRQGLFAAARMQGMLPLRTTAPEVNRAVCLTADCPSRFSAGRPTLGSTLSVGYAF